MVKKTLYKGVTTTNSKYKRKDGTLWVKTYYVAKITLNSKKIRIGQARTQLEAAKLYDDFIDKNNITTHSKNFA